jgi:hypothetical protein
VGTQWALRPLLGQLKFAKSAAVTQRTVDCVGRAGGLDVKGRPREHGNAHEKASRLCRNGDTPRL